MVILKCGGCGIETVEELFSPHQRKQKYPRCKSCMSKYAHGYNAKANKDKVYNNVGKEFMRSRRINKQNEISKVIVLASIMKKGDGK